MIVYLGPEDLSRQDRDKIMKKEDTDELNYSSVDFNQIFLPKEDSSQCLSTDLLDQLNSKDKLDENVPSFFPKRRNKVYNATPVLKQSKGLYRNTEVQSRPCLTPKPNTYKSLINTINQNGTKINLTLNEITQINQMQFNQLQKINQVKHLQPKKQYQSNKENINNTNIVNNAKKTKKHFSERAGDWVCVKCKNLNFSFRSICNRCQITKAENDKLYEQYMNNLLNYCRINDMLHSKYSSPNISIAQWIPVSNSVTSNEENISK